MSDTDGNVTVSDDNLDAFSAEFFGSAKQEEVAEVEEVVEDTPEAGESEDEPEEIEDETADEGEEPEEVEEPVKTRKTAKDRIRELANEKNEEREARIAAEARLKLLEEQFAKLEDKNEEVVTPQNVTSGLPDPDATDDAGELVYPLGEFDPKYIAALTKHLFQQEAEAAKAAAAKEAEVSKAEAERKERFSSWENKLTTVEETLPDLRDKLATLDTTFQGIEPQYGIYLADVIMQMDRGPEVLYYLAENIDEAQKIVASDPVAAIIALGRLEGIMTVPAEKRSEKRVSKAPEPPTTTKGIGASKSPAGDTDDLEAFEREFFRRK